MRAGEYKTIEAVERELDRVLTDLRRIQNTEPGNTNAMGACEYRIASLRRRKRDLEMAA